MIANLDLTRVRELLEEFRTHKNEDTSNINSVYDFNIRLLEEAKLRTNLVNELILVYFGKEQLLDWSQKSNELRRRIERIEV